MQSLGACCIHTKGRTFHKMKGEHFEDRMFQVFKSQFGDQTHCGWSNTLPMLSTHRPLFHFAIVVLARLLTHSAVQHLREVG